MAMATRAVSGATAPRPTRNTIRVSNPMVGMALAALPMQTTRKPPLRK